MKDEGGEFPLLSQYYMLHPISKVNIKYFKIKVSLFNIQIIDFFKHVNQVDNVAATAVVNRFEGGKPMNYTTVVYFHYVSMSEMDC